jgi:uncharacterized protein
VNRTTTATTTGRPTADGPEKRVFSPGGVQLRDVEEGKGGKLTRIAARAVPYGVRTDIGWYVEEFAPGAFGKSIRESAAALPLLLFHNDRAVPIGVAETWDEQKAGLDGVWRLDRAEEAQNAARLAADGMLNFMSVRFQPIRSEWQTLPDEEWNPDLGPDHKDAVIRTEARLVETSLVSTPAYNGASVTWVRTAERAMHKDARGGEVKGWREYLERMRQRQRS